MCVEQFPTVVCVESSFLQPDSEIMLVQSPAHEFRIASCSVQSGEEVERRLHSAFTSPSSEVIGQQTQRLPP